jgi:hypothetical protein
MRPCGCLPSYIFLGQNCVKFYEVTKRPRLIQVEPRAVDPHCFNADPEPDPQCCGYETKVSDPYPA